MTEFLIGQQVRVLDGRYGLYEATVEQTTKSPTGTEERLYLLRLSDPAGVHYEWIKASMLKASA